jgi:hypothetical protein
MTLLTALLTLEAATLESMKRDVNTPKATEALDFLEPYIRPLWLIPQYRLHLQGERTADFDLKGQQQSLRPCFRGIRTSVRELLGKRMYRLVREFATARDPKIKQEIDLLGRELTKLRQPWGE